MTHFVDLACYFLDNPPVEVITTGNKLANNVLTITFENGSLATIFMTSVGSFGYPKELIEIYHQGAAIIIDHLIELRTAGVTDEPFARTFPLADGKKISGMSDYYKEILATQREAIAAGDNSVLPPNPDKGHYRLLDAFVKEVAGGPQTPCGIDEAMKSTAIILKAIESLEKGCAQEIKEEDFVWGAKDSG
jgi:predicted dehydrogenase